LGIARDVDGSAPGVALFVAKDGRDAGVSVRAG